MRRITLFALALALLVAACGGGSTHPSSGTTSSSSTAPVAGRLSVSPAKPRSSSEVTLAFIAPVAGGRHGASLLSFALTLAGPRRHAGCLGARTAAVAHVVKGAVARVRLGGRWCVGSYSAAVEEFARPYCRPGLMCPQYVRLVSTVATVRFRVSAG